MTIRQMLDELGFSGCASDYDDEIRRVLIELKELRCKVENLRCQLAKRSGLHMTIDELVKESYATALSKGFHDGAVNIGEKLALVHSEISEALEAHRQNGFELALTGKPEGFAIELADAVIRIADLCGSLNIDLDSAIARKMAYNQTRPYKHGKVY